MAKDRSLSIGIGRPVTDWAVEASSQPLSPPAVMTSSAFRGFDDSLIYNELNVAHDDRIIPAVNVMRDEALLAFREWSDSTTKVRY